MIVIVLILAATSIISITAVGFVVHGAGIRRPMPGAHEVNHVVIINANNAGFLLRFPFHFLRIASSPPERCTICRRRYKPHHQLSLLRRCGHVFHARCILPWLATHQSCPLCRRHVDDGDDDMTSTTETTSTHAVNHTSNNDSTAATHGSSTDNMASTSSENHLSIDTLGATHGSSTDQMAGSSSVNHSSSDAAAAADIASSVASCVTPAPALPCENEIVSEVIPVQEGERYRSAPAGEEGVSDSEEVGCSCSPCCCFGFRTNTQKNLRAGPRECESGESTHLMGCFSRCLRSIYKPRYKFRAHGGSTAHQPNKVRAVIRFFSHCFNCTMPKKNK